MKIKLICILWYTGEKTSYTFPPCVHADFSASDANPVHFPLAKYCVPCVPSGTGGTLLSQPSHKTTQAPCSPPGGPFWPSFTPGGGTDPPPPGQGPVWATQGRIWQKSPEKQESHFSFSASLRLETKHTVPRFLRPGDLHRIPPGRAVRLAVERLLLCRSLHFTIENQSC